MNGIVHRSRILGLSCLGMLASLVGAAPAHADVMLVVMDLSGSMTTSRPNTDGHGATRFDAAKYLATNSVAAFKTGRHYGLWTFNGSGYTEVVPIDESLSSEESRVEVLSALGALTGPTNTTPLAGTLCSAVDELIPYFTPVVGGVDERPILELFSDGLENSTPASNPCYGPNAVDHFNPEPGSWEYKVRQKARTGSPAPSPFPLPPFAYVVVNADYLFQYEESITLHALRPIAGPSAQLQNSPLALSLAREGITLLGSPSVQLQTNMTFYKGIAADTKGAYRQFADADELPQLGDMTGDGCVDIDDYNAVVANWNRKVARKSRLDPNADGRVDMDDYATMVQNFGKGCQR